jgi:8-oxo-dGTP diphosphatase
MNLTSTDTTERNAGMLRLRPRTVASDGRRSLGRAAGRSYSGAMVDEAAYPVLFGTTQASWAPIDLRFELLTGQVDPARIARVFVVPFIGEACVVVGFKHGDWGPAGGGLEPGESVQAAPERELAEEAGGRLLTYMPFAGLHRHSRAPAPIGPMSRTRLRLPVRLWRVELVGPPQLNDGPERTVAVQVLAPEAAVSLLVAKG